ncbi:hypothetical protein PUS13_001001, partial [Campylobacter jejuni]|nr:hypothetical protein [Campylobacter jejuni]
MLKVLLQKLIKFKRKIMNSIKIKLSLIANLIAIFALIVLGIVSFYFTKTSLHESALNNQTDLLKVTQYIV